MRVADSGSFREFNAGSGSGGTTMDIERNTRRRDRLELASRGMLGLALLAGVAWALMDGGFHFGI